MEDRSLDPHGRHLIENCGKLVLLDKLLVRLKANGHRVLIFSQMTRMLDVLDDYLVSMQYPYCRIDGKTSYEERADLIDAYNAPGSDKFVFLLSTRAGGLGINLQTADTVVLFDSDWNPQADLQAQDRAHRIGQKKKVHVYRLVTENSIEEKVVERAHQKLKLDAMVVQQGRLADGASKSKLSKDDMLAAVKFGADQVFRSSESSITNADIDQLIERGQKRTEQLHAQLGEMDKGDAYDFSFKSDGGFDTQVFQGVDYSDPKARQAAIDDHLRSLMTEDELASHAKLEGQGRARKPVANYNEDAYYRQAAYASAHAHGGHGGGLGGGDGGHDGAGGAHGHGFGRALKLPKHMRLPRMEDWQFYDGVRLRELYAVEEALFAGRKAAKTLPSTGLGKLKLLEPEAQAEKDRLLAQGFGSWGRQHYYTFIKASAKYGRHAHGSIAKDVNKSAEEVAAYAAVFWARGEAALPGAEWDNVVKRVEKGERKLGEISRLTESTAKFLALWTDPLRELRFKYVGTCGHVLGADEDRHLLVSTNTHGYGNWARIRAALRSCETFRFDYFLRSLSAAELGKRCETLMREAAKELCEVERRAGQAEEWRRRLHDEAREQMLTNSANNSSNHGNHGDHGPGGDNPAHANSSAATGPPPPPESGRSAAAAAAAAAAAWPSGGMKVRRLSGAECAALAEQRARLYIAKLARLKAEEEASRLAESAAAAAAAALADTATVAPPPPLSSLAYPPAAAAAAGPSSSSSPSPPPSSSSSSSSSSLSGMKKKAQAGGAEEEDTVRDSGRYVTRPVTAAQLPALLAIVHDCKLDSREKVVAEFIKMHPGVSKRQVETKLAEVAVKETRRRERAWWLKPRFLELHRQAAQAAQARSGGGGGEVGHGAAGDTAGSSLADAASSSSSSSSTTSTSTSAPPAAAAAAAASSAAALMPAVHTLAALPAPPHPAYSAKALFRKQHLAAVKARLGGAAGKKAYKDELERLWGALSEAAPGGGEAGTTGRAVWEAAALQDVARFEAEKRAYDDAAAAAAGAAAGAAGQKRARDDGDDEDDPSRSNGGGESGSGGGASGGFQIPKKKRA